MRQILIDIAKRELRIPILETRGSDRLDFHEVYAPNLGKALIAAYEAGQQSILAQPLLLTTAALADLLKSAAAAADSAVDDLSQAQTNQAIGGLLPFEDSLKAADSLLQTIFILHRLNPVKGGAQ